MNESIYKQALLFACSVISEGNEEQAHQLFNFFISDAEISMDAMGQEEISCIHKIVTPSQTELSS